VRYPGRMSDDGHIDLALLERWHAGDRSAAAELVQRHQRPLLGFLLSMCGERALAEDLLQETFLRVLERLVRYEEHGRFRALLFQIARNLCSDHFRTRKRRLPAETGTLEALPDGQDAERGLLEEQRTARLHQALAMLPDEQREVVLLHHYSGLTFREIAELQGCPLGTSLGRMHYALKRLRALLPQEEWAHGL
jgi:RNA polymerase sigma-70 factor, ECF subfamily